MAKSAGKSFENQIETSCKEQGIFYHRIRDTNIPLELRARVKVAKNKYDSLLFHNGYLFPVEFKSGAQKSFSFSESIIKKHQIDNLLEATKYNFVIPGFVFNFREENNETYFVHINDFVKYKSIAESKSEHTYKSKVNKSSIPIDICREIGVELKNVKKKTAYRYYVKMLLEKLIKKYGEVKR